MELPVTRNETRTAQPTVMWLRRDLRLADNPALVEATQDGPIVPLFVVDPRLWERAGPNRLRFLLGCLRSLDADLDGRLVIRTGDPVELLPLIAREVGATTVHVAADHGPYGAERDERVAAALAAADVDLVRTGSAYAVEPGTVLTQADAPYKVFTPFLRAWRDVGWADPIPPPASPECVADVPSEPLPDEPDSSADLPEPGEAAALRRLDTFLERDVARYDELRDHPAEDATSRLSPYLKWGCIHPRQVLHRLGRSPGEDRLRTEIAWREFYADVLLDRPDTVRQAYQRKMRRMRVDAGRAADDRFGAWAEGRTGYPFVDAGMRQLLGEGWVHNRVRMVVASFLVKDLHVDWTRGARHFMRHLVDGDLASNTHGWQWVAGTGTDASPFFRVFNPVAQSKKFDPRGEYIRRWVPELAHLDDRMIHEPWRAAADLFGGAADAYPDPIVDHAAEREDVLARYDEVR